MKKLKILSLLFVFTALFYNSKVIAQACGQGVFSLEIYTPNGEKELDISYEIFALNRDSLEALFSQESIFDKIIYSSYYGYVIQSKYALRIINSTESGQKKLDNIFNFRLLKDNQQVGEIVNGHVQFNTIETVNNLLLLKLYSNNKEVYVIANLFGGCDRTSVLLWNERPQIVLKQ